MPVVDYESAWFELKARIVGKRSHSARELAETMAELEVGYRLPEGQEGFDDRPFAVRKRTSDSPAGDEPERDLREPARIASAAS